MVRTISAALMIAFVTSGARADSDAAIKSAIDKGLRRIEQGAGNYIKNRQCFSCHHQATSIMTMISARKRGFTIAPEKFQQQVDFTLDTFKPKLETVRKGQGVPGANTMTAYALMTLETAGHRDDDVTRALVEFLLVRQKPDGSWPALTNRPPTEGSPFTNAAFALRALRHYGPPRAAKEHQAVRQRVDAAFAKGKDWLLTSTPATTEDKVFHLRALVHAEVPGAEVDSARQALLKEQRDDGSWAQLAELGGDAYATGTALMSLRVAGLDSNDSAYQKAVKYLLSTQKEDGSWLVTTRSRPVQVFFDNGDPGGKSQFISFAATNWALLALLETIPVK